MPFQKGQSGNPSGRPKTTEAFKKKLGEGTEEALDAILKIMKKGKFEGNRLAAAKLILDKGLGNNYRLFENDGEMEDTEVTVRIVKATKERIENQDKGE